MKGLSNFLLSLALCFSILLLCYVIYKSEFVYSGNKFHYYFKYYLFSIFLIILAIVSYLLGKEIKVKIFLVLFSSFFGLYLAKGIWTFSHIFFEDKSEKFHQNRNIRLKNDIKAKLQIYEDLKREGSKVILYVPPANFIEDTDQEIFPLSSMSNTKTILSNENGYNPIYQSDRYGFNNPDDEWDKNKSNSY